MQNSSEPRVTGRHEHEGTFRHWRKKVVFQTSASRTYSVQLQHAKHGHMSISGPFTKEDAAILARDFYLDLRRNGWEAALAHHKGTPMEKSVT